VLVSPYEFGSWKETIEIKSDKEIMEEIRKGLASMDKKSSLYTLEELFE